MPTPTSSGCVLLGRALDALTRPLRTVVLLALLTAGVVLVPVIALGQATSAPTNLVAIPGTASPVLAHVTWSGPVDGDADHYRVYASVSLDEPGRLVGETASLEFNVTDGLGGQSYYFMVSAVNDSDEESELAVTADPVAAIWAANPHVAADVETTTCGYCHASHSGANALLQRSDLSTEPVAVIGICYTCHDGRVAGAANVKSGLLGFDQPSGHVLDATATASADLTNSCGSCHPTHGDPAVPASGGDRCYICHQSDAWYDGEYPELTAPIRDTFGYPIAGTWPGEASYESTANAHRSIPETTQTVETGEVRRDQGDCLYCHSAHGSENPYDGLIGTYRPPSASTLASDQASGIYADACFRCHGGVVPSGLPTETANIKQFVTAGGQNAGHRVRTAGGLLPVGSPLPCYECHGPHGSTRGNESLLRDGLGGGLNTGDALAVRRFCFTCHTTGDTGLGWDSVDAAYESVAGDLVVGLSRDETATALRLPALAGHRESDSESCYVCHGSSYVAGGANVHNPASGGASTAKHTSSTPQCYGSGCHAVSRQLPDVHAEFVGDPSAKYSQYTSTCTLCHDNDDPGRIDWASATADCTSCHPGYHDVPGGEPVPHQEREALHTLSAASDECVGCHSSTLIQIHGSIQAVPTLCGGCHSVHANANAACDTCHAATDVWSKTADCVSCHQDKFDGGEVGPDHYDESAHTATPFTTAYQGSGADGLVASGGEECSDCHSASLATAHSATSTSGGAVSCAECHTDQNLGSSATVSADWPIKKCTDCHDAGAATTHDSIAATHTVEPGSCAGTGSGCHDSADLMALHASSQSGGEPVYQGCSNADMSDPSGCHNVLDVRPPSVSREASCGEGSGGCHADKNPDNHAYNPAKHAATLGVGDILMGDYPDPAAYPEHGEGWTASGIACSLCHFSDLATQHGGACTPCHSGTDPAGSLGTWDRSCQQGDCHPSIHTDMAPSHNGVYDGHASSCDLCHTGVPEWPGDVDCTRCHAPVDTVPDTIAPITSSDATSTYTGTATIQLTAVDNPGGKGVDRTYYILDGGAPAEGVLVTVPAPGFGTANHTLQFYSVDLAGNTESAKPVLPFEFAVSSGPDATPPAGTMSINGGSAFTNSFDGTADSDVTDAGSGLNQMSIDPGSGTFGPWIEYAASAPISIPPGDGVKTVRVAYSDNASNIATLTDTITLDTAPPTTTSDALLSYVGAANITLAASDIAGGSGVADTHYRIDSGPEQVGTSVVVAAPAGGVASHTLYYWSVDNATNVEAENSAVFSVEAPPSDETSPTTTSSFNPVAGAIYNTPQPVSLTAEDTGGSGVNSTFYRIDNGPYTEGTAFSVTADGLHTFSYYSVDNAGNAEVANVSNEFRIDTVAPVTASGIVAGNTYTGAQAFQLTPSDIDGSGVAGTWWQLDSTTGPWTSGGLVPVIAPSSGSVVHTLYWYSTDIAGNPEQVRSVTFSVAAPSTETTLAFRWEPQGTARARLNVYTDESRNVEIAGIDISNGTGVDLNWYVTVTPGQRYWMWVQEVEEDGVGDAQYGIWSDDVSINPDGILSEGETVEWWY